MCAQCLQNAFFIKYNCFLVESQYVIISPVNKNEAISDYYFSVTGIRKS